MALVVVLTVFLLASVGVYLLLARRTFPTILGVSLIGHAVNLIVLSAGRVRSTAPLLEKGEGSKGLVETMADPMPQALVLTDIVISMAITLYLIAVMGLTAKAVKSLLSRARANLREALQNYVCLDGAPPMPPDEPEVDDLP